MKKVTLSLFALLVGLSTFFIIGVHTYAKENKLSTEKTNEIDQVIVTLKEDVESNLKGIKTLKNQPGELDPLITMKVPKDKNVDTFIDELEKRKDVESVEPDRLLKLEYTPNDPYFRYFQYHHKNIETERAWDKTRGTPNVVVAVLDNGIDLNHPDLVNQLVSPYDAVSRTYNNLSEGEHGTHVAGIIGSSINNYLGGAGVAPSTSIMPIDVFAGEYAYTSDVIQGIYQAVAAGTDIINMSLGSYYYSSSFDNAVQYAYQNGVVIVAAAGNDATTSPHYPSSFTNVISVGSTTSSDTRSYFSNYGSDIDLTAPGSSIYSTVPNDSYGSMSGTSMASPVVAGVAALLLANEPSLTNDQVASRLYETADDIGNDGKDFNFGFGRVNAKKALKIKDIPVPNVFSVYDTSDSVGGYIPFEIENAKVTVSNQSGDEIGSDTGYSGFAYFSIKIPKQIAGTKLYVTISDNDGNKSEKVEVTVGDITPPSKPVVNDVTDQSTRVTGWAEIGTTVSIFQGESLIDSAPVDSNGTFEVRITKQKAGTELDIKATDEAGNVSESTKVTVKDVTAPSVPSVNEVTESSTSVSGTAEAGSTITVKAGTAVLGTATVDTEGKYTVTIEKQKAGTKLTVTATDEAGNISEVKEVTVKDVTAPSVPTVNAVYDNATAISGKAESNAKVYAMVGSKKIGEATAKNGAYSIKITKQKAESSISVYATDSSGNKSASKSVKVIDKTAPSIPTVNAVYDNATVIRGKAESGAKVYAIVGSKKIGEATAKNGQYTIKITKQKADTSISVNAVDTAGNKSASKTIKVIDKTAPSVPTVNNITSKTVTVTGKGEKGASIYIYNGSKKIGQGIVDSRGYFKAKIKAQKKGSSLKVYAQDKSGNKSKSKTMKVS
ncbi:Ig-like domain-containing protein [Peribacillus sp. NPDC058075]|uniref:Ig-like domain-containing protein n=1 Tax=unclassified Peribacillus TaxID=2675266 RepID=UPI0036D82B6D